MNKQPLRTGFLSAFFALGFAMHSAHALETKTETEKAIDRYRELIADGNPADLYGMEG